MSLRKSPQLTPALLAAARHNARHSTGRRSPAAKQNVKLNALKHGAYVRDKNRCQAMAALGEDPEKLQTLTQELMTSDRGVARGGDVEHGATARPQGVPNRPAGGGRWAEIGKKMLFRGNELKILLKIKNLAFSGPQNELLFECRKPQSKQRIWPKIHDWTPCARLPCSHSESL
jgi:hypothetical protein